MLLASLWACGTSSALQGWDHSGLASSSPLVSLALRLQHITLFKMGGRSRSMKPPLAGSSSWDFCTSPAQCSMHSGPLGSIRGVCFTVYLCRIPERFFPGKVDIVFHSHQLFHCFVIAGAFVHYHGISNMALHRYYTNFGFCTVWYLTNHMIMQAPHWRVPTTKDRPVSLRLIISHCDMLLILPSRVQPLLLEKWISMKNTKKTRWWSDLSTIAISGLSRNLQWF